LFRAIHFAAQPVILMAPSLEGLVDQVQSSRFAVWRPRRLICCTVTFAAAALLFMIAGAQTARADCPQGQTQLPDGTCLANPAFAQILANEALCPPPETINISFTTCLYPQNAPGYGTTGCSFAPPLPSSSPPISTPSSACCPVGQAAATILFNPEDGQLPYLIYTGTCCPAGQVPLDNGTCTPRETFVTACPGNAPYNSLTKKCCAPGSAISSRYQCCAPGLAPQPNGTCGCPSTALTNGDGSCSPACPTNSVPSPPPPGTSICSNCPPGVSATLVPGCCPSNLPGGYAGGTCQQCPSGQIGTSMGVCCPPERVASNGFCCPSGYHTQNGLCTKCPSGQVGTLQGACCAPDRVASDGSCCSSATQNGICRSNKSMKSTDQSNCGPGETRLDDGRCGVPGCGGNEVRGPDGNCTPKAAMQCANGLVPREAYRGDPACVTLQSHDQTLADNLAAPSHTNPEGLCSHGYFWRRAKPSDHVCVTVESRARVQQENAQQPLGVPPPPVAGTGVAPGDAPVAIPPWVTQAPNSGTANATGPGGNGQPVSAQPVSACPQGSSIVYLSGSNGPASCVIPAACPNGTTPAAPFGISPKPVPPGVCCPAGYFSENGLSNVSNGAVACITFPPCPGGSGCPPVSVPPAYAACPPGWSQSQYSSGSGTTAAVCTTPPACGAGYALSNNQCVPTPATPTCFNGQVPGPAGTCICPPGEATAADGTCRCQAGQGFGPNGTCVACVSSQLSTTGLCCPTGQTPQPGGTCTCPAGLHPGPGGSCVQVPVQTPTPPPSGGVSVLTPSNPEQCSDGFLPREAYPGDPVCVTRQVHDQTIADNLTAPSRTMPNGNCVAGYVWREANARDHACVLPETRTQTWTDNQRQCGDLRCAGRTVPVRGVVSPHPTPTKRITPAGRNTYTPNWPHRGVTAYRWAGHQIATRPLPRHRTLFGGSYHLGRSGYHFGGGHFGGGHFGGGGRRR
jgi:hypothetical protein